jgi:protein arginine kinase activator
MRKEGLKMRTCELCGENPANIHIRQIVNGQESELFICSKCAENLQKKILSFLKVNNFMTGMMQNVKPDKDGKVCPVCKFDIEKIRKLGKVGCANCYEVFEKELEPVLHELNITRHKAAPEETKDERSESIFEKIDKLQNDLNQAVIDERYERAAELRDEIALLKGDTHDNMAKHRA